MTFPNIESRRKFNYLYPCVFTFQRQQYNNRLINIIAKHNNILKALTFRPFLFPPRLNKKTLATNRNHTKMHRNYQHLQNLHHFLLIKALCVCSTIWNEASTSKYKLFNITLNMISIVSLQITDFLSNVTLILNTSFMWAKEKEMTSAFELNDGVWSY